jgi:hypothetical protein
MARASSIALAAAVAVPTIATKINRAHERVIAASTSAIHAARQAGDLLLEAKRGLPHGAWLPWLGEHCPTLSPWTAQAYMRVARRWPELEAANTGRVTHLSTRAALQSLTMFSAQLSKLSDTEQSAVLEHLEEHGDRLTGVVAIVRRESQRRRCAEGLTTSDRPRTPTDRVVRVFRETNGSSGDHWTIRIGPNQAALDLRARLETLNATPVYVKRAAAIKAMHDRVAQLRAKANEIERAAHARERQMKNDQRIELERQHGPAYLYAETVSFWRVDDDLANQLSELPLEEQIDALYAQSTHRNIESWLLGRHHALGVLSERTRSSIRAGAGFVTLVERLATFFRSQPNTWHDGRTLAGIAGAYGWRSRISDCRRGPFFLRIANRQRRVRGPNGSYVISEYRLVNEERGEVEDGPRPNSEGQIGIG